jgi:hypothetical protein
MAEVGVVRFAHGADAGNLNFTANPVFPISGSITPSASGSGATVTLTQGSTTIATTAADTSGNFTFNNVVNGTYTVTPTRSGFGFTPTSKSVTVNGAPVTGVSFTAQAVVSALAIDKNVSTDRSSSSKTIASPAFTTSAADELLLAFVSADGPSSGTNTTVSSIAGGSLAWVLVRRTNTSLARQKCGALSRQRC